MPTFEAELGAGLKVYEQAIDKGEAELMTMGFPPASRPRTSSGELAERPGLPVNMSDMSMSDLQNLLAWFTAWHSYAIEHLPRATKDRDAAETAKDFAWAKVRREKRGTVSDKNDATITDVRYIEANAYYETCDYKHRKLKAVCDGLYREIETISRAITALEQRKHAEGHYIVGERRGYRYGAAATDTPKRADVLQHFRAKK